MISQLDLLRKIKDNFNERKIIDGFTPFADLVNEINDKVNESVSSFSQTISEISEKVENLCKNDVKIYTHKLNRAGISIDNVQRLLEKMYDTAVPLVSAGVYERCEILKDDIDLFERQILSKISWADSIINNEAFNGLRVGKRLNIFLTGAFSAGKTTFLRRLISDHSGPVSGGPVTASLVIHKQDNSSKLSILFNDEFIVKDKEKFENFTKKYELHKNLRYEHDVCRPYEVEKVLEAPGDAQILSILTDANYFPEAFKKFTWYHTKKENKNKLSVLDFADLYDMPGIGGNEEKHNPVIEEIYRTNKPDIILYLIKTENGIITADEREMFWKIMPFIANYNPKPLFVWVYQQSGNEIPGLDEDLNDEIIRNLVYDKKFLSGKKKDLNDIIDYLAAGEPEKGIEPFDRQYINFLRDTFILDARGNERDSETAENAVSAVLCDYFYEAAADYVIKANEILSKDTKIPLYDIMTDSNLSYHDNDSNPFIDERIIKKIRGSDNLSVENVKKIFLDSFCFNPYDNLSNFPYDLRETLSEWRDKINGIIDEMIDFIAEKKGVFKKVVKGIDPKKIYNNVFWGEYIERSNWKSLLSYVRAYHWLKFSFEEQISLKYIIDIAYAILNNIKKDAEVINKIKSNLPFMIKLDGPDNVE